MKIAGAIDAWSVTNSVGGPQDWYVDKNGNLLFNANLHNQADLNRLGGGQYLGKTYWGDVNNGGKEYGFSGGSSGSVILSMELPELKVVSDNPCEYCLGGAGEYGPASRTNKQVLIISLTIATLPLGGEGGFIGDASLSAIGS